MRAQRACDACGVVSDHYLTILNRDDEVLGSYCHACLNGGKVVLPNNFPMPKRGRR